MIPVACVSPPTLPCNPTCRGWRVEHEMLVPCAECEHWAPDGAKADEQLLRHMELCRACADYAVSLGAVEPVFGIIGPFEMIEADGKWSARVRVSGHEVVRTAGYPSKDAARAAAMAWISVLRGRREF